MSHLLISQKQRDQICVMLESLKPEFGAVGSRDVEVRMRRDDVDLIISTLAALTQPASPALKLPVEMTLNSAVAAVSKLTHESRVGSYQDGWNACIAEFKRLNAPHTAPLEPICATGGAEWVKVSDEMPNPLSSKRVCVYTPSEHDDFRFRFVPANLFRTVCSDATHWHYMEVPND